jgi:hypothetical protein
VLAATLLDGSSLDLASPFEDACAAPEVDVSGGEVVRDLVMAAMIVMVDEACDGEFEIAGRK